MIKTNMSIYFLLFLLKRALVNALKTTKQLKINFTYVGTFFIFIFSIFNFV